ncbi:MAG: PLP-dependent aminotransferase family protein [Myxococcaceae bacterium]|nr:PLP-dependent aminotransferase family protein [Myxococcaceae bacterium]
MTLTLARRTSRVTTSAVREILKVAERPDVLSFAGGLPAPELFPVAEIARAHAAVLERDGQAALQYSTTEGFGPLREHIAADFRRRGVAADAGDILVTTGSQQGLDLAARVLLDPGAVVVVENPSYLAALQVFAAAEARVVPVASDDDGIDVAALAAVLAREDVRLIYLVPNFQNPRGTTLSALRRQAVMSLAQAWRVPVLEDDPYGELRFRGAALAPLASLDEAGLVISLGTFSKTLAPGLRLGWVHAAPALMKHLVVAKQAADLHCGSLAQRATAELLATFDFAAHLTTLRRVYGERCDAMLGALERHFPAGTRFTRPDGGLFVWAELPGDVDTGELLETAVHEKVAFVPGAPFFAGEPRRNTLRLNFSNRRPELIEAGMARLGGVLREFAPRQPVRGLAG